MSLFITSLNSGSNGNCYYIGNDREAVLIDAGISCRETEKRMLLLGLSMKIVKAIFVSHEHADHIKGIPVISQKYSIPVFVTSSTFLKGSIGVKKHQTRELSSNMPVMVGDLSVTAFPKYHDAHDPHSFIISYNGITIGVFTDIGSTCDHVTKNFSQCHAAFLEANYDENLLENGRYPHYLKNRIRGGRGHLSNTQALELFISHKPPFMTHLVLSHLSKENNSPQLVEELFNTHAGATEIIIASRYEQTRVLRIQAHTGNKTRKPIVKSLPAIQMNMFV